MVKSASGRNLISPGKVNVALNEVTLEKLQTTGKRHFEHTRLKEQNNVTVSLDLTV